MKVSTKNKIARGKICTRWDVKKRVKYLRAFRKISELWLIKHEIIDFRYEWVVAEIEDDKGEFLLDHKYAWERNNIQWVRQKPPQEVIDLVDELLNDLANNLTSPKSPVE